MAVKLKRRGTDLGIEMRSFDGNDDRTCLVFRTKTGAFHVFVETEAKEAARICGATADKNTRTMWTEVWNKVR